MCASYNNLNFSFELLVGKGGGGKFVLSSLQKGLYSSLKGHVKCIKYEMEGIMYG